MKLTDTQLIMLSKAAQRDDNAIADTDKRSATRDAVEALLKAKYLKHTPKIAGTTSWPGNDGEAAVSLVLTAKGLKTIEGHEPEPAQANQPASPPLRAKRKGGTAGKKVERATPTGVRETSKLGMLITLLKRPKGAGLDDMCIATGWQAHSVRGAISGSLKKKLGLTVTSSVEGETRIYRIAV
ncbi:MAG: DUF3489 domain-containing protein [Micropepsaceae bacterium]